ncbi:MAG TPA: S1 RNA-binding domain-containing protein [Candidatus Wallbacteria bacterium]|nr:S1 RNA-binding domain-containing protein [Candidatus Wallbacteria bacterium]
MVPATDNVTNEKKVVKNESIETMEQAMASMDAQQAEGKSQVINRGNVVLGKIIKVASDVVYVDVHHKSDGIIQIAEFTDVDETPEIGSTVSVMVMKTEDKNGDLILSKRKADQKVAWDNIINCQTDDRPIKAKVIKLIKGGYEASYKGVRCFVPSSQMADRKESKTMDFIGNTYDFKILEVNKKRGNIILSRKALIDAEENSRLDKIFGSVQEGGTITGTVKSITEYGAFIDIGGIDGLLHITDMSYGHVSNPADIVSIGATVTCKILRLDRVTKKISLGLKQLTKNPWEEAGAKYTIGSIYDGTVKNTTDYGVFITLEPGVDGLIHISDLSWSGRVRPSDFKAGQQLKAKVLEVNIEEKKIKFGLKQVTEDPWKKVLEAYPENTLTTGKVKSILNYGAFIELEEGIEGFVHVSNLSWTKKVNHPSEVLKLGQETEVKILKLDLETKKINLGIKQTHADPWTLIETKYAVGQVVTGTVTNVKKFGAFVELEDGIEGLIHISDLSWTKHMNHANEVLKNGEKVTVKILEINGEEKKIALGYKHLLKDPWSDIDGRYPIGGVIEGKITHFTKFGAFIEVEEGIEGLLHTSDLSWTKKFADPSEALKDGDTIKIRVLNIDKENRKISLGLKQLTPDPLIAYKEKMDAGDTLDGKVKSIQEYGAFIEFEDGLEGLVHISQLAEERVDKVENVVKVGQAVKVKVIDVNAGERKIKLSMRANPTLEKASSSSASASSSSSSEHVSIAKINAEDAHEFKNVSLGQKLQDAINAKKNEEEEK